MHTLKGTFERTINATTFTHTKDIEHKYKKNWKGHLSTLNDIFK